MNYLRQHSQEEIDPEREKTLWNQFWMKPDDDQLRMRLVETYLPLVVRIVNKLTIRVREKVELEDLLGAGVIGLHDAISNFSKHRKATFGTFAYKRVRGAILDELRKQDHLTRTQRRNYRDICAAIKELTEIHKRPPTDQEIADQTGIHAEEIQLYIGLGSNAVSLNDDSRGEGSELLDFLADDKFPSPAEATDLSLSLERLRQVFRQLEQRDQQLLFLRHFEDLSVKELAVVFNVSEGRICQIYKQIILKMRALMQSGDPPRPRPHKRALKAYQKH